MEDALVAGLALLGLDLQSGLHHVEWCGEEGSGHTCDGTRQQQLPRLEPVPLCLVLGVELEQVLLEMGVRWEVDGRKGDVSHQARCDTLVQTRDAEAADDLHRGDISAGGVLGLHLQSDLDDLDWVGEYDLAHSRGGTGENLAGDAKPVLAVDELVPHEVVDGELDGLFWGDTDELEAEAGVEPRDALALDHLGEAVD